ncbi:helix-turn-helix transcriptional regulator [Paenibacillus hubeiensis]|uniref:helix-turn-helix transcriptional regulator n=1 Tax=Paenibacillus hubeiensis TaxID=3077330 RepID=UPI0031B9C8A0
MSLIASIKLLCAQKKTSIPRVEQELGLGKGTIYTWGKSSPSIDNLKKVAAHFNVSVSSLLEEEPVKAKSLEHRKPISRLDSVDSRMLKKEFLRLVRTRSTLIRTLCKSDQDAIELAQAGAMPKGEGVEAEIEALLWRYVGYSLELSLKEESGEEAR